MDSQRTADPVALIVARDLLRRVRLEGGPCPLCGVIAPECRHVIWAKIATAKEALRDAQ